jgi:hypothetical protein
MYGGDIMLLTYDEEDIWDVVGCVSADEVSEWGDLLRGKCGSARSTGTDSVERAWKVKKA